MGMEYPYKTVILKRAESNVMNVGKTKSNKQFMLLTFLGILFMLDDHSGHSFNLFANIFPYNSFYMPLFFFISGYFCNIKSILNGNLVSFLKRKTNHLFVPYVIINVCFGIITIIINNLFQTKWNTAYPFGNNNFFSWITYGTPIDLSSSMWFVICLFETVVAYSIIRTIFKNFSNEISWGIIFCITSIFSVYLSRLGYSEEECLLPLLKIMFFLFYYQCGVIFKIKQSFFDKNICLIGGGAVAVNIIILQILRPNDICFNSLAFMRGFQTDFFFLPVITSLSGILFWYCLSKLFYKPLGDVIIVNKISNNSLYILAFHLAFFNIFNFMLYYIYGTTFDIYTFQKSAWYLFLNNPSFKLIYFFFSLIGSLLLREVIIKIEEFIMYNTIHTS